MTKTNIFIIILIAATVIAVWMLLLGSTVKVSVPEHLKEEGAMTKEDFWNRPTEEWKKSLSEEEFLVLREGATERPFSGSLLKEKRPGVFSCAACDNTLFLSKTKYDSGCGWPCFYEPASETSVLYREDYSILPVRIEVLCGQCGSHLGHVFPDGPHPTGQRYCINSIALHFNPKPTDSLEA